MDTVVTPIGPGLWTLEDRLGRPVGSIKRLGDGQFAISPTGKLTGVSTAPFASLSLAMSAIETQTKGACQLATRM